MSTSSPTKNSYIPQNRNSSLTNRMPNLGQKQANLDSPKNNELQTEKMLKETSHNDLKIKL